MLSALLRDKKYITIKCKQSGECSDCFEPIIAALKAYVVLPLLSFKTKETKI